jgi:hypothetical protein
MQFKVLPIEVRPRPNDDPDAGRFQTPNHVSLEQSNRLPRRTPGVASLRMPEPVKQPDEQRLR